MLVGTLNFNKNDNNLTHKTPSTKRHYVNLAPIIKKIFLLFCCFVILPKKKNLKEKKLTNLILTKYLSTEQAIRTKPEMCPINKYFINRH